MYKERQGRPIEKKKKSFQPQQSRYSLQPPPFSQTSPPFLANFIQDGRKWGKQPGISAKLKTQEEDVKLKEWHFPWILSIAAHSDIIVFFLLTKQN